MLNNLRITNESLTIVSGNWVQKVMTEKRMPTNKLAADRLKKDDLIFFDLSGFYFFRDF